MATKRSNKELADEIDEVSVSLTGGARRRLQRVAAELRGESLEPTPNEARQLERAEANAEQLKNDAKAAEEALKAAKQ